MVEGEYPELEKAAKFKEAGELLSAFVDWLEHNNIVLCRIDEQSVGENHYVRNHESYQSLFARFFGIDLEKFEQEHRALLDRVRQGS